MTVSEFMKVWSTIDLSGAPIFYYYRGKRTSFHNLKQINDEYLYAHIYIDHMKFDVDLCDAECLSRLIVPTGTIHTSLNLYIN